MAISVSNICYYSICCAVKLFQSESAQVKHIFIHNTCVILCMGYYLCECKGDECYLAIAAGSMILIYPHCFNGGVNKMKTADQHELYDDFQ